VNSDAKASTKGDDRQHDERLMRKEQRKAAGADNRDGKMHDRAGERGRDQFGVAHVLQSDGTFSSAQAYQRRELSWRLPTAQSQKKKRGWRLF
jgi:hypothetical protein